MIVKSLPQISTNFFDFAHYINLRKFVKFAVKKKTLNVKNSSKKL